MDRTKKRRRQNEFDGRKRRFQMKMKTKTVNEYLPNLNQVEQAIKANAFIERLKRTLSRKVMNRLLAREEEEKF